MIKLEATRTTTVAFAELELCEISSLYAISVADSELMMNTCGRGPEELNVPDAPLGEAVSVSDAVKVPDTSSTKSMVLLIRDLTFAVAALLAPVITSFAA